MPVCERPQVHMDNGVSKVAMATVVYKEGQNSNSKQQKRELTLK